MKKFIAALIAVLAAGAMIASPTHAEPTQVAQTTTVAPTATVTSRPARPVRVIRSLASGATVATFRYGTESDQIGDVYYDTDWAPNSHPAVVVIHGGWWHNGTRANSASISQKWFDAGFVVYNIEYRVAADHAAYPGSGNEGTTILGQRWPAQRQDVARANDWLRTNAAQFGTAADRIGAYGFSAGGHLSHKVANFYGTSKFKASASVGAVLQPTRTAEIAMNGSYGGDSVNSTLVKSFGYMTSLIGCSYEPTWYDCGNKWKSIKLETDFDSSKPPMYIIKGDSDAVEPYTALGSINYWANYYGQSSTEVGVAGGGHDEGMISGSNSADIARWNALVTWMKSKTA